MKILILTKIIKLILMKNIEVMDGMKKKKIKKNIIKNKKKKKEKKKKKIK